jgi:mono/diheme cytochrome c family protein
LISKIMGALVAPFFFFSVACGQTSPVKPAAPAVKAPAPVTSNAFNLRPLAHPTEADLARGAKFYKANCVRCHNADPNKKGSIGPEQIDAPFDVVVAKVMTGKYPEPLPAGFTPKRKTHAMTPVRNVKNEIPYIHAWIQSVKKKNPAKL